MLLREACVECINRKKSTQSALRIPTHARTNAITTTSSLACAAEASKHLIDLSPGLATERAALQADPSCRTRRARQDRLAQSSLQPCPRPLAGSLRALTLAARLQVWRVGVERRLAAVALVHVRVLQRGQPQLPLDPEVDAVLDVGAPRTPAFPGAPYSSRSMRFCARSSCSSPCARSSAP